MHKIITALLFLPFTIFSQIPGENFFGSNQVIRVDITFNQTGFWDSLTTNYTTETDMMAIGFKVTDNTGVYDLDSIAIRLKGNSSYGHPGNKKSFKVDLNQNVTGQDYDGLKKLNFNNGFKDPTFMREKVFFDLCKVLGIPAPRVNYANVYMNGTFWGFYTVVEQIDDQFLDWAILDDQGNLFKAGDNFGGGNLAADLMYYGASQTSYEGRYELKTNENANDWSDLISLIDFINNSSASTFGTNLQNNMNKNKLLQSIVLDNLFSSLDSYLNSARNYYLYHNLTTNLWEWIKWDGNEAFGLYTGGPGTGSLEQLAPNYIAGSRPLVSKIFADATLYQEYLIEMCDILGSHFNSTYMNTKIDEIKNLIQAHVTADVNKMYTTQNFIDNIEDNITVSGGPMGSQTVLGLKSFVSNRNAYLLSTISCEAGLTSLNNELILSPNPFTTNFQLSKNCTLNKIQNAQGQDIRFTLNQSIIELSAPAGIYFITFENEGKVYTSRLVKE